MKPSDHEDQWSRLLDAIEPDAAELAAVEAGLREFDDAPPLSGTTIASLVANATAAPALTKIAPAAAPRVLTGRRLLLIAAALLLALPSVAWFARGLFVQEQNSTENMTFGEAVAICSERGQSNTKLTSAVSKLGGHCYFAAEVLAKLQAESEQIAQPARQWVSKARDLLEANPPERPQQVPPGLEAAFSTAQNPNVAVPERELAIEVLGQHLTQGIRALTSVQLNAKDQLEIRRAALANIALVLK